MTYSRKMDIATDDTDQRQQRRWRHDSHCDRWHDRGAVQLGRQSTIGNIYRTNLTGTFTALQHRDLSRNPDFLSRLFERPACGVLADDLRITGREMHHIRQPHLAVSSPVYGGGNITALTPGTNVLLMADDGHGTCRTSNPFNVTNPAPPVILTLARRSDCFGRSNVTLSVVAKWHRAAELFLAE